MFSTFFQLVSQHEQKLPVPVILHTFPKVQPSGHSLQIQIFHTYCIISFRKLPAELMLEIFSLVLYLFMT